MKKLLSVLLVAALVLATLPLTALPTLAATSGDFYYQVLSETKKTCEITGYTGSATVLTIPSELDGYTVTSIGEEMFWGCTSLASVTIPDSVTSIGYGAFYDCTALTSITIPDSVMSIGNCAFEYCTALTSITIPDSVTNIGYGAFKNCTALTSIAIPDSVTSIAGDAFYNTAYYNDATCWENDVLYIGNHLIDANDTLSGAYTIRAGTKTVAGRAFYMCTALTSITIPDSVTSIGGYAFYSCTALTSITIPDSVTSIGDGAFSGCTTLTSITIPNSVTSIGGDAFSGCTALESITIPNSVTSIGDSAFYGCTALTSITIPDSVTGIGGRAFYSTAYYNDATHWENDVLYIGNHLIEAKDTLSGAYTVRAGSKTIADRAFDYCTALTSITIPNSVTSIGICAFENCTALTSITIPNSVTRIGGNAFYGCTALESITIPNSVIEIGLWAFSGCTLLTTIYGYTGSYAETYAGENGYTFIALDLVKNDETDVSVVFPPENLPAENTVLNVEKLSAEENAITYDISLTVNGEAVQPASAVTVKIPVPETMDGAQCKVYRQEADGTYTDMQATYQNGYMVFTTDHFSTYILTTKRLGICLGDLNGDDKINAVDARWVLQAASGARTFDATQTAAADVNGDGKVNAVDARWILQVASGARTL